MCHFTLPVFVFAPAPFPAHLSSSHPVYFRKCFSFILCWFICVLLSVPRSYVLLMSFLHCRPCSSCLLGLYRIFLFFVLDSSCFARFLLPAFCFVEFSCILLKLAFCFSTCLSLCVWMPFWPCQTLSNRHLSTLVDTQISVSVLWAHWLCILNMNPAECNRLRCILLRWTT